MTVQRSRLTPVADDGEVPAADPLDSQTMREVLFRYAATRLSDPFDAEDAVQETLVAALSRTEPVENLQAYLFGILKNKIADHHRRASRTVPVGLDQPGRRELPADPGCHETQPGARLESQELAALARQALAQLPDRDRDLLTLRMAGASVADTASSLGLTLGSTRVAQVRALRRFQSVLNLLSGA